MFLLYRIPNLRVETARGLPCPTLPDLLRSHRLQRDDLRVRLAEQDLPFVPPDRVEILGIVRHWSMKKFTVTRMRTSMGTPSRRLGVNCHCRTAASAAFANSASAGARTRRSLRKPSVPTRPSRSTVALLPRRFCGYRGFTSLTLVGGLMHPPTGDWLHGSTSGWLTDCRDGGGGGAV